VARPPGRRPLDLGGRRRARSERRGDAAPAPAVVLTRASGRPGEQQRSGRHTLDAASRSPPRIGLFEDDLRAWQGVWGQDITSLQFYETDDDRDFVRGAKWGLVPTGGPLWAVRSQQWGDAADWGAGFADLLRTRFSRSAQWSIIGEDLPEQRNTVTLSDTVADGDGLPAPVVTYRTSENSRSMLAFNLERARESLLAAGAYRVVDMPQVRGSGWHLLGTAVMGDDPSSSVVDRWGQSHDVPNLWIFDGSTWPTSSGMNPTATIAAFALRGAERMLALQGGQGHGPR
jgi:choline dehydrogenase-like flavoprotein